MAAIGADPESFARHLPPPMEAASAGRQVVPLLPGHFAVTARFVSGPLLSISVPDCQTVRRKLPPTPSTRPMHPPFAARLASRSVPTLAAAQIGDIRESLSLKLDGASCVGKIVFKGEVLDDARQVSAAFGAGSAAEHGKPVTIICTTDSKRQKTAASTGETCAAIRAERQCCCDLAGPTFLGEGARLQRKTPTKKRAPLLPAGRNISALAQWRQPHSSSSSVTRGLGCLLRCRCPWQHGSKQRSGRKARPASILTVWCRCCSANLARLARPQQYDWSCCGCSVHANAYGRGMGRY